MKLIIDKLYDDIKFILEQARNKAVRSVNHTMVLAYWQIGKRIVEEEQGGQQKANYGERLLEGLSAKLKDHFGKGFTPTNLRYMRQFFYVFPIHHAVSDNLAINEVPIHHALRDELSWTHYRLLLKVENEAAREYYMNEASDQNWSTRALERQINSLYYERLLSSKNKKVLISEAQKHSSSDKPNILDFVKDPYILEFLNLNPQATLFEKELETELLNKLQQFLLELGRGFSFVARQKRVSADNEHFYIDLVFYNYILKCFVLIDLKTGKLAHQDIGQMDLYVRFFEEQVKQESDNPTIGIILCTEKNETVVRYSVLNESKQLFASKYKLYLPTEKELIKELQNEIAALQNKKLTT